MRTLFFHSSLHPISSRIFSYQSSSDVGNHQLLRYTTFESTAKTNPECVELPIGPLRTLQFLQKGDIPIECTERARDRFMKTLRFQRSLGEFLQRAQG